METIDYSNVQFTSTPPAPKEETTPSRDQAAGESKGENQNPSGQTPPATETPKFGDEDVLKILNERGIQLSKLDELKAVYEERTNLKTQIETLSKKEPEFKSDKAKALFEFANKHEGYELAAAKNLLNVVSLDLKAADPKTLQFEAFALKYPNYSREEAKAIFDAQYENEFGDETELSTNPLTKFKHDQAILAARQTIEEAVKGYREAKSPEPQPTDQGPTPEEVAEVQRVIDGALKDFKGANVKLGEYKTKVGPVAPAMELSVALKPEEAARFKGYLTNPESFIQDVLASHKTENGFNTASYVNEIAEFFNRKEIYSQIHQQGIEQGMLLMLNHTNNSRGGKSEQPEAGKDTPQRKSLAEQYESTRQVVQY